MSTENVSAVAPVQSFVHRPLPQRFQWKMDHGESWRNGVVMPRDVGPECDQWMIEAGRGFGSFDEDPWEVMGQIIGDAAAFRWIDNDYDWHPHGGICCDTVFESSDDLREHIRACHR